MTDGHEYPPAHIIRRTHDRVIVKCPYCNKGHVHGALRTELILGNRVSHCATKDLAKTGAPRGGTYRIVHADGTPA